MNNRFLLSVLLFGWLCSSTWAQTDSLRKVSVQPLAYAVPAGLLGAGLYSRLSNVPLNKYDVHQWRMEHFASFRTEIDDYLPYAPVAFAYGLGVIPGAKSKSDFMNKSVILAKSHLLMVATVYPLKSWVGDRRPDSGTRNAWPSGHTTEAFVAATFLHHEYKHLSPWISVAAYTCAGAVGALRLLNNRHWSADVLGGAAIGMLCTHTAYLTHRYKWRNPRFLGLNDGLVLPYYSANSGGIFFYIPM